MVTMAEQPNGGGSLPSVKKRVLSGAALTLGGVGVANLLRFGSNLILTRLLFPEAFGVMAIVNMFMQGLKMFSDIGIGPAIIQHELGGTPSFQNTAWTLQILRGIALAICTTIIAWPVSVMYDEPALLFLLPMVGANEILRCFGSMSVVMLSRDLILGKQVMIEFAGQIATIATMIGFAYVYPSPWALVLGGTAGTAVSVVLSHTVLPGIKHRLTWDREAVSALFKFGRWITLSTAFSFLSMQADRAVLSAFASMAVIGVFSVAANLSQVVSSTCSRLISSVLFPLFSMWNREQPGALSRRLRLVRGKILAVFLLPPCLLAIFGDFIIQSLYDNRYHDAGWMLTWLSIGLIPQLMVMTTEPILLASGDSFRHMTLTVLKGTVTLGAIALGGFLDGVRGILIGSVVGSALQYPLLIPVARSTKVWMPLQDLLAVTLSAALIYFGKMAWGR